MTAYQPPLPPLQATVFLDLHPPTCTLCPHWYTYSRWHNKFSHWASTINCRRAYGVIGPCSMLWKSHINSIGGGWPSVKDWQDDDIVSMRIIGRHNQQRWTVFSSTFGRKAFYQTWTTINDVQRWKRGRGCTDSKRIPKMHYPWEYIDGKSKYTITNDRITNDNSLILHRPFPAESLSTTTNTLA